MYRVLLVLFFLTPLVASDFNARCLPRDIGYLELEAAVLFWKVYTPGFYIGTLKGQQFDELVLRSKAQTGARFAMSYYSRDQCHYLTLIWHHFDRLNEERGRDVPTPLFTPNGLDDVMRFEEASIKFEYNSLELLAGRRVICLPCLTLDLFAGLAGARMLQRNRVVYISQAEGSVPMRSRVVFEGLGLEGGACAEFRLCRCLDLLGSVGVAYMLGERKRDPEPLPDGNRITFQDITEWVPAFYARGGLRYSYRGIGWRWMVELGVAYRHYANVFLKNAYPPNTDVSFSKDFTVGGPYVSVKVRF